MMITIIIIIITIINIKTQSRGLKGIDRFMGLGTSIVSTIIVYSSKLQSDWRQ